MTTTAMFGQAKDPADSAWYVITLAGVTLTDATPAVELKGEPGTAPPVAGIYSTPGDDLPGGDLTASSPQVVHSPAGDGVAMLLAGGRPGWTYAVQVEVVAVDGSHLFRSAILVVMGL